MCEHKDDFSHQVAIPLPDNIDTSRKQRNISADVCCVGILQYLWSKDVQTISHCCGHNKLPPSIVVQSEYSPEDILKIKTYIANFEGLEIRKWKIYQWKSFLTEV